MLILVGVTINVALNGGLFGKAQDAKSETLREMDREELYSAVVASYDTRTDSINRISLVNNLGIDWEVTGEDGGPWTCTSKNGNEFIVYIDGTIEDIKPSIAINPTTKNLKPGDTLTLTVTKTLIAESEEITYTSNNANITLSQATGATTTVTVSEDANIGEKATITATCAGKTATCTITVIEATIADYFDYTVDEAENEITITGLNEAGITAINNGTTSFTIPDTIEGKPVTKIGEMAFTGVDIEELANENIVLVPAGSITEIFLPNSIKVIGNGAFMYSNITSINFPNGLTTICFAAFAYSKLTEIQIPTSVSLIGDVAFVDAQLTGTIEIDSNKVTTMGGNTFSGNNNLIVKVNFASTDKPNNWDTDWDERNIRYLYR